MKRFASLWKRAGEKEASEDSANAGGQDDVKDDSSLRRAAGQTSKRSQCVQEVAAAGAHKEHNGAAADAEAAWLADNFRSAGMGEHKKKVVGSTHKARSAAGPQVRNLCQKRCLAAN